MGVGGGVGARARPDRKTYCVCVVTPSFQIKVIVEDWSPAKVGLKASVKVVRLPLLRTCGSVVEVSRENAVPDVRVQEVHSNCDPTSP